MPVKTQALTGRLAPFRFMESPSLNGIAINGKPQASARISTLARSHHLRASMHLNRFQDFEGPTSATGLRTNKKYTIVPLTMTTAMPPHNCQRTVPSTNNQPANAIRLGIG